MCVCVQIEDGDGGEKSAPGLMMCLSRFTNERAQCLFPRTMWY